MPIQLIRANALDLPLADGSVDLVVTSPPYFGLRSYQDGGEHYAGQIGDEATPTEFVDALVAATREMARVLKPSGSIWINLGDRFSPGMHLDREGMTTATRTFVESKSLLGIPWRYALRCIDELGLILRAEVIWSKCLSGGTEVYARVNGREKVVMVKDLARCEPGAVELWTGEKWSPMLRCDPTPPSEGRSASSTAARQARYRGKPVPALVADLEVEFRNGVRVGCTPNHKWPTARGIVRADELTVGDVVPQVRLPQGSAAPAGLDDEMTGWLVGLYIAEGSRSEDMVQIASHVRERERFERLQQIADAFDGRLAVHETKGNAATANLSGKVIRAILDTYVGGRTAGDKRLAPACWRRSDTFIRAVLDGYLSGDGHHDAKNDRWTLGFTANDGLATDLRAVAARLGYSIRLRRCVHKFGGRDFPGWSGTLYIDPSRRKRPDSEVVAIRQSRARQFWNIEIADEPHEFALASGIVTENSNGLPESVTDRVRRSHEQWFHFTLNPRYYSAVDEIREPHVTRDAVTRTRTSDYDGPMSGAMNGAGNPLGKLPGSVWTIPTEPLRVPDDLGVDHFAAFPTEWPRRIIQGWSPRGVCVECGEGRRPVSVRDPIDPRYLASNKRGDGRGNVEIRGVSQSSILRTGLQAGQSPPTRITGEACACPDTTAPTTPGVVLDPFGGTGTTALVADVLGRHGISVDMSADYLRIAQWRTTDPRQRAKAAQREYTPPPPQIEGQAAFLFGEETA